jgi:hypothetical protein
MSTRNLPGGKGLPTPEADLTAICEPVSRLSRNCGSLDVSQPYGPSRPVTGIAPYGFIVMFMKRNKNQKIKCYLQPVCRAMAIEI